MRVDRTFALVNAEMIISLHVAGMMEEELMEVKMSRVGTQLSLRQSLKNQHINFLPIQTLQSPWKSQSNTHMSHFVTDPILDATDSILSLLALFLFPSQDPAKLFTALFLLPRPWWNCPKYPISSSLPKLGVLA